MTRPKTFEQAAAGLPARARRDLAMEWLENIRSVGEAWDLLDSVGADIDDEDVLHHLQFNPHLSYVDLEVGRRAP